MRPVDNTPTVSYQLNRGSVETEVTSDSFVATLCAESASSLWPQVRGYEILSVVGSGGMGIVYKARDRDLQRTVALKMLHGAAVTDPDFRERIQAEAEAVARLQHPNIIQVFEIGTVDSLPGEFHTSPFISFEFVDGGSLSKRISVPQPPEYAAEIVEKLARAAHAAHRLGVVHRDLKPANVLMTAEGEPKIADFGVAKQIGPECEADGRFVTQPGIAVGTPEYMAPEQVSGDPPTPAIDIYALGVMLYEMLTARVPFHSTSAADTMLLVLQQEPVSPRRFQPGVPRDLETICMKCLHKVPGKRYHTAEALADDLQRWRDGRPILARPVGSLERAARWANRNPVIAALTACVVVVALAGITGVVVKWREASASAIAANDAARQAEAKATEARQHAEAERTEHYRANILASSSALRLNNVRAARKSLESAPIEDRNWEWRYFSQRLDASIACLTGHDSRGYHAILSTDGRRAMLHSNDNTIRFWDIAGQRELRTYRGPEFRDALTALSPDGAMFAHKSGENHLLVLVKDFVGDRVISELRGHTLDPTAIVFAPDNKRIATGAYDGVISVWECETGKRLFTLREHKGFIVKLAFSRDGKQLASIAAGERKACLWNAETGALVAAPEPHEQSIKHIEFSRDGRRVVTVEDFPSNAIRVWDAETGRHVADCKGHSNTVRHLAFSPDGRRMLSSSNDQSIRVWNIETGGEPLHVIEDHNGWVNSVEYHPDGRRFVSCSEDNTIRVWDATTFKSLGILHGHTDNVIAAAYTPDGSAIVSASGDGTIRVWDPLTHERGILKGHGSFVYSVAFHPDNERVASAAWDGTVRVWNATTGRELQQFKHAKHNFVCSVAFHPGGELLASMGRDEALHLWNLTTGKEEHAWRIPGYHWQDSRLAFNKSGDRLAVGCENGKVFVFDVATRAEVASFHGHKDTVRDVAFSPDGRWLVSSGGRDDRTICIWDLQTNQLHHQLTDHRERVYALAFSDDGQWLASGDYDGTVRIWDVPTWTTRSVLKIGSNVHSVAFTPDRTRLAVACVDNTIRFWDMGTMREVAELLGHKDYVHAIAFSPDGTRLVSGSGDHTVRIWDTVPFQERIRKK